MIRSTNRVYRTPAQLVVLEGYNQPSGYQRLMLYRENPEGRFVSTASRFSSLVMDDIESLGDVLGIVTPTPYHQGLHFRSPAVVNHNDRRIEPKSIYRVLRNHVDPRSKSVTLALPHANRHRGELELRQVRLKPHVSSAKRSLLFSRWMEAVNLQLNAHNDADYRAPLGRPRFASF
ncbi:MAG: hypothetical protein ABW066_10765 [Sedimenticola sp.]